MWYVRARGLVKYFTVENPWYMVGKCDNKDGDLNQAHMLSRVCGIREGVTIMR